MFSVALFAHIIPRNAAKSHAAKIADGAVTTDTLADSAVTSTKVAAGMPVQIVNGNFSAVATGTTIIPGDDTIPQNTEGTEFMTLSITPKSATNILVIDVRAYLSVSTSTNVTGALFQDSNANAIAATETYLNLAGMRTNFPLLFSMPAGTTSSTTFKFRMGPGTSATVTMNGASSARLFGAISKSAMMITEYKA